jgi:hypothetical protein
MTFVEIFTLSLQASACPKGDNSFVRVCRALRWCVAAVLVAGGFLAATLRAPAFASGPPCGEKTFTSPTGVGFRILFANNGTVQQYIVTSDADNIEAVNDARISLENTYGPAGWNAPPLKIISYRKSGSGGMMIPDKAIDSCGRTITFN